MKFKSFSVIPGFGWTFGLGAGYFSVLVLLPFAALIAYGCGIRPSAFAKALGDGEILSALGLSLRAALVAGLINLVFGFILAWSIERYRFPGRSLLDSLVDIPFALPTAVAGVSISFLLSDDGYIGKLVNQFGFSLSGNDFTGITFALVFVGIPFVVRTLRPGIKRLDASTEEAAEILGATPLQTFLRVTLPPLIPPALTGFSLAFARAVGEYGSVIFVSSNLPFKSQILPVVIVGKIESHNYDAAVVTALIMLAISAAILGVISLIRKWSSRNEKTV